MVCVVLRVKLARWVSGLGGAGWGPGDGWPGSCSLHLLETV